MDQRPGLADAFRRLRAGEGPLWITWDGRRLLIAIPTADWLAQGIGPAIIATRRGYRRVDLIGRVDGMYRVHVCVAGSHAGSSVMIRSGRFGVPR